jgi:hypothetical protein
VTLIHLPDPDLYGCRLLSFFEAMSRSTFFLIALLALAPQSQARSAEPCGAEVKLQLAPAGLSSAVEALAGKKTDRTIVLFDTPHKDLFKAGVILRYREGKKKADLTAKLRPVNGKPIAKPTGPGDFKCETDVSVDGSRPAYSVRTEVDRPAPRDGEELRDRLAKSQATLLQSAPIEIAWGQLTARSPVASTEWEANAEGMHLSLEQWKWEGHTVLELSTKVPSQTEVAHAMASLQGWAKQHGLQMITGGSKVSAVLGSE